MKRPRLLVHNGNCHGAVDLAYTLLRITSDHSTSDHSTSRHIRSHHGTSDHITSHHIRSHHIRSHHTRSDRIPARHITAHYLTAHHITSKHVTSRLITACHITSHHSTSHHITRSQLSRQIPHWFPCCSLNSWIILTSVFDTEFIFDGNIIWASWSFVRLLFMYVLFPTCSSVLLWADLDKSRCFISLFRVFTYVFLNL